jgi:hypothetical protein
MLREKGNFVAKFFKSSDLSYLYVMMKQAFSNVYVVKPQSSRASSAEAFVVGLGFLGEAAGKLGALSDSIKTLGSSSLPQGNALGSIEEQKKEDEDEEEEDRLTF